MTKNLKSIIFLWSTSFAVWVLSYVYQFLMVRFLSTEQFAEFASLIGIINLLAVLTAWFSYFLVKELSKSISLQAQYVIIHIVLKYGTIMSTIIFVLYCLITPILWWYLKIPDILIIIVAWAWLLLSFPWLYQNAYYQIQKSFYKIWVLQVLNPILRIIIWVGLILLWTSTLWAVLWFIIPIFLIFFYRYYDISHAFSDISSVTSELFTQQQKQIIWDFKELKKQLIQFFWIALLIALFMNIDILVIKNIFDSQTAWYYAALSVLAKFLVFLWMSIETVYYPQFVSQEKIPLREILRVSTYYIAMTAWAIVFFMIFWKYILNIFKPWLIQYWYLITPLLIFCGILWYLSLISKTAIAFWKYWVNWVLFGVLCGIIWYIYIFSPELQNIVWGFIIAMFLATISILGILIKK